MNFIYVDVETTGLSFEEGHRIVEVALRRGEECYRSYVNPGRESDPGALKVHGCSSEFLSGYPTFAEIIPDLLAFLGSPASAVLAAHNATFDFSFLNGELKRAGYPHLSHRVIDTLPVARFLFPGEPCSLDALCKRFSVPRGDRDEKHSAVEDTLLLQNIYERLETSCE